MAIKMQSKRWMPSGAASPAALLLASLCLRSSVAFQTRSPPSTVRPLAPVARSTFGDPLFATSGEQDAPAAPAAATEKPADDAGGGPDILQPYLPALDPDYSVKGPIGEGKFLVSRSGPPTAEELANEQMLAIVKSECTDLEANTLVWKCLGYRFAANEDGGKEGGGGAWSPDEVFPKWKERFPDPPDFIGMRRVYSRDVDEPSLRSNQALVRSIPMEQKQSVKPALKPLGWKGFQRKELTPNKTRRAQVANWLIFYRDNLFGYTVEELKERRRAKKEAEEAAAAALEAEGKTVEEGFKPPVNEVF